MESPSPEKREAHVITIEPNATVLTALPYRPHTTLLDFLKGEPELLGAIQILLALIIMGLGIILAFNYNGFYKKGPVVFFTGYPFWGALMFLFTGVFTIINENSKQILGRGVMAANVISSLTAVAGITFTIISFTEREFCQVPFIDGPCVIGRTLLLGILSVLLIISIAELSISVTIASFRSTCWTSSDEVVFFLPSDVTGNSETPTPEENAQLQFELQEDFSNGDTTSNIHALFFGGYAFFKLRVSRSPLSPQHRSKSSNKSSGSRHNPSALVPKEEIELKHLPSTVEVRSPENTEHTQLNDEDLQFAVVQPSEKQAQLLQDQALPPQVLLTPSAQKLLTLLPEDLSFETQPIQALPTQTLQSKPPSSDMIQSHDVSEDMPSQDTQSQGKTPQDTSYQDMIYQDTAYQNMTYQDTAPQDIPPKDLQPQTIQPQSQESSEIIYQDILTEVMELTQDWKSDYEYYGTKSSKRSPKHLQSKDRKSQKRHSLDLQRKGWQSQKRHSLDLQGNEQSPRRKSLDQQIKAWLSPKRYSLDKQAKYNQTTEQLPDQQAKDQKTKEEQPLKEQSKDGKDKDQQVHREKSPQKQTKDQQAKEQEAQEEKYLKGQSSNWQAKGQQAQVQKAPKPFCETWESQSQEHEDAPEEPSPHWTTPNWKSFGQQSQDWRSQGWRNKDWKAQEWQFKTQPSLGWESQDLLEKEALRQKALYQEVQIQTTTAQENPDQPLQNLLFQVGHCQGRDQQDFQSRVIREDMHTDSMQIRDSEPEDMEGRCQKPMHLQSEDMSVHHHPSSQSLVQDTYLICLSTIDSEQEVQKNTSGCSNSCKDLTVSSSSCDPKEQEQSEDSD